MGARGSVVRGMTLRRVRTAVRGRALRARGPNESVRAMAMRHGVHTLSAHSLRLAERPGRTHGTHLRLEREHAPHQLPEPRRPARLGLLGSLLDPPVTQQRQPLLRTCTRCTCRVGAVHVRCTRSTQAAESCMARHAMHHAIPDAVRHTTQAGHIAAPSAQGRCLPCKGVTPRW